MTRGPEGGRFSGTPYTGLQVGPPSLDVATNRPLILFAQAALEGGLMTARFGPPPSGMVWLVRRITVTASAASRAYVYIGEPTQPGALVAGTRSGQLDESEASQPYYVPEGSQLVVQWTAGPTSATARLELLAV